MARRCCQLLGAVGWLMAFGFTATAADDAIEARMRKDITFLASDECEGRGVETKGINKAADFIADEFKKAGLKPGNAQDSYFQPFTMPGTATLETPTTLVLKGPLGQKIELERGKDFQAFGNSGSGKVSADVVFAGFGAESKRLKYDDYAGLDVEGKVVVILRNVPRADSKDAPFDGDASANHSSLATKIVNADLHKAAAVLFVNSRTMAVGADPLVAFKDHAQGMGSAKMPVFHVKRSVADQMLQASQDTTLKDLEKEVDRNLKPRNAALKDWSATLEVTVKRPRLDVKNVVGILEGSGPLAKETLVIGAHYDHLGYGQSFSLAKNLKKPTIHYGADDNGSGTTAVIELARRFGAMKERQGRRLVFVTFSGEESGLLGSVHYCKKPAVPLEDTVAMINLDMVGRLRPHPETKKDTIQVWGTGTSTHFDQLIESLNENYHFHLKKVTTGGGPSDHASFYEKKLPVFFFFTEDHPDYHRPTDTADKINVPGMRKVCDLTQDLIGHLTTVKERPNYIAVAGASRPVGGGGPTLGVRPGYAEDKEGMLIEGVVEGRPAAKAGMKAGDLIVDVEGKPVKNIEAYMVLMRQFKLGDTINVTVLRGDKKVKLPVKLE